MSVELEEADLPLAEAEEAPLAPEKRGAAGAGAGAKRGVGGSSVLSPSKKRKNSKKKNQPGKYSQLVVESIRQLGERSGSSLAKIYSQAKKVPWFDQQNGRTYLKYSIKALVQNDTLVQVKGTGANGSFKLNRKKLEGEGGGGGSTATVAKSHKKVVVVAPKKAERKAPPPPPPPPPREALSKSKKMEKKSHKKGGGGGGAAKKKKEKAAAAAAKKAAKKKKGSGGSAASASAASPAGKKVKKSAKPKALKSRK